MLIYEITFLIGIACYAVAMASGLIALSCPKDGVPKNALRGDSPPSLELLSPRGQFAMRTCRVCQVLAILLVVAAFFLAFVRFD